MPHEYELKMEIEVAATPEQVWEAISSGPGIDSWFMGRTEVEPREGGSVRTDLGGYVQESVVTAFEPLHRFGYRTPTGPDSFLALEWLIEGREGGSTVVRSVGSGFIGNDDWEAEYDSLRRGGRFYFHNLSQYLTHFAGRTATPICAALPYGGDAALLWTALRTGLGVPTGATTGDRVRLTPAGLDPLDGVVDYAEPGYLGIRTDTGLFRFYEGMGGMVMVEHHIFAGHTDSREIEQAWQSWLVKVFA